MDEITKISVPGGQRHARGGRCRFYLSNPHSSRMGATETQVGSRHMTLELQLDSIHYCSVGNPNSSDLYAGADPTIQLGLSYADGHYEAKCGYVDRMK